MLLNDSIELECNDSSASAEPLPVNWDIDLSKIWIPSSVLLNRKRQINPNENKPFILYTLEKSDYSKTFSVYSDESPPYHESQTSSVVPPRISCHELVNDNNKHELQQVLSLSQNVVEWDVRLDKGSENVISPKHPVSNSKLDNSLRDSQEMYNSMIRNSPQWEEKASDSYSMQETSYRASLEDLTRRMAEILSEDEPLKENWHHEDVIKSSQITTGSIPDSIPPSTKDSLEELYYSDDDENQFAVEYELDNLERESSEKKPTCNIYTENPYVQEHPFESFVNDLEHTKYKSDETAPQLVEETEKIQFENQKEVVDNACSQSETNGIELVAHTKDSEQELLNYEEKSEDLSETLPEYFPIAYKRPPLKEQTNKTKSQKEKKKAKKTKKHITLDDLFQSEKGDRFKVPEVDEFYENLVRQGKCQPRNQDINISGFPSVNFTEQQANVFEFPSTNMPDQSQNSTLFSQNLSDERRLNSPDEIIRNEEKDGPELETKDSLATLVIDNIPLNVTKENIDSFVLGFGEVKNLTIEQHANFQRAILQMDFMCEIDWIIDCLNDSQPFGSSEKELIKCYRQT